MNLISELEPYKSMLRLIVAAIDSDMGWHKVASRVKKALKVPNDYRPWR